MAGTRYPNLRQALTEPHRRLPDRAIERVLARQGLEAGAIEDFGDTFSAADRPGSPQLGSISGASSPPSIVMSASAARTELGIGGGSHSRSLMAPVGEVIVASACARMMPGLLSSPPQLPE